MKNKRGFEFSFSWLFAIIVGISILALAIYSAAKLINNERNTADTEGGKQLGILLNPLETSLESDKIAQITFSAETRVFNACRENGAFGSQEISIATKSSLGDEWGHPGVPSTFHNKYLFSDNIIQSKKISVFAKSLNMPYKVADVVFAWDYENKYCFVNPPNVIRNEIESIHQDNLNVSDSISKCPKKSEKVCFSNSGCDIDVNLQAQRVLKSKKMVYYALDSKGEYTLLYGAIFSSPEIYECQLRRLMGRASELALLYKAKSNYLSPKGCNSNLEGELGSYSNMTRAVNNSASIIALSRYSEEIGRDNELLSCKLF